jgi:hypothetical protein
MRSDAQEQILAYLRQDAPIEVPDAEPTDVLAYAEPTRVSLPPIKPTEHAGETRIVINGRPNVAIVVGVTAIGSSAVNPAAK